MPPGSSHESSQPASPLTDLPTPSAASHSAYLSALRQIDRIPVPDLASTLTTPPEPENDSLQPDTLITNSDIAAVPSPISFVRGNREGRPSLLTQEHRRRLSTYMSNNRSDASPDARSRLERLDRVMAQLNREHSQSLQDIHRQTQSLIERTSQLERNIMTENSTTLRTQAESERGDGAEAEYFRLLRNLSEREAQRMHRESATREGQYSRITRQLRELMRRLAANEEAMRDLSTQERSFRSRLYSSMDRNESGFRTGATPRYGPWHSRLSSRNRDELLYHRMRGVEGAPGSTSSGMQTDPERLQSNNATESHSRPRRSQMREYYNRMMTSEEQRPSSYHTHSSSLPSVSAKLLEDTVAYLGNLRNATSVEECQLFAASAGLTMKDIQAESFVLGLGAIPSPAPTSLLAPGATFSGEQFANSITSGYTNNISRNSGYAYSTSREQPGTSHNSLTPTRRPPESYRRWPQWANDGTGSSMNPHVDFPTLTGPCPYTSETTPSTRNASQFGEKWPVTVRIFSIDYDTMTLSASMEAYDVPSHPSTQAACNPAAHSLKAITTYLEGEIVDFHTHSLMTENFTASLELDAIHWRKLPPFNTVPPSELPAKLLNRDFLAMCNEKYVLMRWKEKCFVHNSNTTNTDSPSTLVMHGSDYVVESDGCGLTISGFYYVSMRREDGCIEGLYCDPVSSPYQFLKLARTKESTFPAWDFR